MRQRGFGHRDSPCPPCAEKDTIGTSVAWNLRLNHEREGQVGAKLLRRMPKRRAQADRDKDNVNPIEHAAERAINVRKMHRRAVQMEDNAKELSKCIIVEI